MLLLLFVSAFAYDYNLFEVEWKPTQCKLNKCVSGYLSTDFNIHGLWPSNWDGSYPQFCNTDPFNITSQTQTLLMTCWLSYSSTPQSFWEHEWSKHGTCMSPLSPCDTYMNLVANLYLNKNFLKTLAIYNIVPSNTVSYSTATFLKTFSRSINVACSRVSNSLYLNNIGLCYDLKMNWINCVSPSTSTCGTSFLIPTA